jgi:hypothetical protein
MPTQRRRDQRASPVDAVRGIAGNGAPAEFRLPENYPNPFSPTTTINFQLPASGFVTLKIYNVLGREITTLVNDKQAAGSHSVKFDAANLPSGVYFYRLTSGNSSVVRKLVLVK